MEHASSHSAAGWRIPAIVWVALAIVMAGAAAVLVFGVAVDRALTYGFFALMLAAHFFMHAGGHGSHSLRDSSAPEGPTGDGPEEDHRSHAGCHQSMSTDRKNT